MTPSNTISDEEKPAAPDGKQNRPRSWKRRFWLRFGIPAIVVLILACVLWVWGSLNYVYLSSQRTGYVTSLAQRGWVCKTWEGELRLAPAPGLADTAKTATFAFTIRNASLAQSLEHAAGREVTLSYDQHRGVPTSCFGETEDYVTGFRVIK